METAPWGVQVCLVEPGDHRGGSQRTRLNAREENGASPYHERFDAAVAVIHSDEANGLSPDRLGEKLVQNVERRHMRFRLRVAKPDQHLAVWLARAAASVAEWTGAVRLLSGKKEGVRRVKKKTECAAEAFFLTLSGPEKCGMRLVEKWKTPLARGRRNMKIIKALLLVLGVLVLAAGGMVGYLTLTEYRPDDIEQLEVTQAARSDNVRVGERLDVLSFNTGYWRAGPRSGFLHGWAAPWCGRRASRLCATT